MFARSAPGQAGGLAGEHREVDVGAERLGARVDLEDRLAAGDVGRRDEDLAVEAARAQQRRVELLEQVRRGDHDQVAGRVEAVHLDQQLVERLLALGVDVGAALRADGVELVDEDDRRAALARLGEQAPDPRGAQPGEHLDERGRRLGEELRAGLAGDGLREQRLARAGRAVEEDALRHLAPSSANRFGSRRNSTTSASSALASSAPATSLQAIDDDDSGLICCGFVRGISFIVRQMKNTRSPMKMMGAHVMIHLSISYHWRIAPVLAMDQDCSGQGAPARGPHPMGPWPSKGSRPGRTCPDPSAALPPAGADQSLARRLPGRLSSDEQVIPLAISHEADSSAGRRDVVGGDRPATGAVPRHVAPPARLASPRGWNGEAIGTLTGASPDRQGLLRRVRPRRRVCSKQQLITIHDAASRRELAPQQNDDSARAKETRPGSAPPGARSGQPFGPFSGPLPQVDRRPGMARTEGSWPTARPRRHFLTSEIARQGFVRGRATPRMTGELFRPLLESLLIRDEYLLFADYQSYIDCQDRVSEAYRDQENWPRMSILNCARVGRFSSDRSIREHCRDIWHVKPVATGRGAE